MKKYKVCGKCKVEKLYDEFGKKKTEIDGKQSWCKRCNTEYLKNWYAENKSLHRTRVRQRKESYKVNTQQIVLEYLLDHPCVDCGETDPIVLDFDHRDRTMKRMSIGMIVSKVLSTNGNLLREEIDKCDVRCSNCHRRKTAKQLNHKRYQLCVEQHIIDY